MTTLFEKNYILGLRAMAEAQLANQVIDVAQTMLRGKGLGMDSLYLGGQTLLLQSAEKIRQVGAKDAKGLDAREIEFLGKASAIIEVELLTTTGDENTWRFMALAKFVANHWQWFKGYTLTEPEKAQPNVPQVHVASMPERISQQTVTRGIDGQIMQTDTVQRDAR